MNAASTNYREISPGIFARDTDQSKVPGVIPPSESREATQRVAAVATGSLWVSAGLLLKLATAWETCAEQRRLKARIHAADDLGHSLTDALIDQAQTLEDCAKELRLLTEDASVRQPAENAEVSDARNPAVQSHKAGPARSL